MLANLQKFELDAQALDALEVISSRSEMLSTKDVLNSCVQNQDEHVDAYVNRLQKLASSSFWCIYQQINS